MWTDLIDSRSSKLLERSMDASNLRQQLLNQNLANVNTPHYKRLDIDFKSLLDNITKDELEMVRTNPRHIANTVAEIGPVRIERETKTKSRFDTNNIDPEYEMAQLSENSLFFQSLTTSWKNEMSRVKQAIEGR